ncbi:MAG: EF-Tu/IF-2/RF-3 family GTPase [Pyrinomonadaceae bacterium]
MAMKNLILPTLIVLTLGVAVLAQKPTPTPAPFLMEIEDVFSIAGVGTIATGKIESGTVKPGDAVEVIGIKPTVRTTVVRIDAFGKSLPEANAGKNIGLLLKGIQKTDVVRGQLIARPDSVKAYTKFKGTLDMVDVKDGGRRTPMPTGFRSQVFFRSVGFSGVVTLPTGKASAAAGEKGIAVEIELTESAGLSKGAKFSLRDGGRTIGIGVITALTPTK